MLRVPRLSLEGFSVADFLPPNIPGSRTSSDNDADSGHSMMLRLLLTMLVVIVTMMIVMVTIMVMLITRIDMMAMIMMMLLMMMAVMLVVVTLLRLVVLSLPKTTATTAPTAYRPQRRPCLAHLAATQRERHLIQNQYTACFNFNAQQNHPAPRAQHHSTKP